jgi:hypothetical protein
LNPEHGFEAAPRAGPDLVHENLPASFHLERRDSHAPQPARMNPAEVIQRRMHVES